MRRRASSTRIGLIATSGAVQYLEELRQARRRVGTVVSWPV